MHAMALVYSIIDRLFKQQPNILLFITILCLTKHLFRTIKPFSITFYFISYLVFLEKNNLLLIGMAYGTVNRKIQFLYELCLPPFLFLQLNSQALYLQDHDCCIYSLAL